MKTGRTLDALAAELQRQVSSKRDFIADSRALEMAIEETDGIMVLRGINGGLPLANTAHEQIAGRLQIPRVYYDRMRQESPELLAHNVNHWLRANPERRLVRTLDNRVRAFLSDRYRPLDNFDLAEVVLPQLVNLNVEVISGELTEHRFYLKATTAKIKGDVTGDVVQAGIVVSNSEIGHGSLHIDEMTYILACRNGAIHASAVRKTHVGRTTNGGDSDAVDVLEYFKDDTRMADDQAFWLKVRDAVGAIFTQERFDKLMSRYHTAANRAIEADPVKVVEVTAKRYGLSESEGNSVLKHLLGGGRLSAYGLANAITAASAEVEQYDRATELESLGGSVIELPAHEWSALAAAR